MASRLQLRVVEFLKDPIPLPPAHTWTDDRSFHASDPSWWVGSREPCAYVIAHSTVSRTQFLVRPDGEGRFFVRNLGTYGTHVDGNHLQGEEEAQLQKRSTIRIGAVYLAAETITDLVAAPVADADDTTEAPGLPSWGVRDEGSVDVWGAWGLLEQAKPDPGSTASPARRSKATVTDPGLARESAARALPADQTLDRILAAAGLPAAQRARAAGLVTPEDIGKLLLAWVKGASSVQFVKREVKESHRLEATATLQGSVNPLRKAIPAEEVLGLLLGLEGAVYARGGEAVKQWFADLVQHEAALPEAVKEAWIRVVRQLSPEAIAERANETGLVGKISRAHRQAAQWEAYEAFFQNELGDAQLSFKRLFVPRFSEAYSEILGGGTAPRKPKRRS